MKETYDLISKKQQEPKKVAELVYDSDNGLLISFTDFSGFAEGIQFLHHNMPLNKEQLAGLVKRVPVLEAVRYTKLPTFEMWWKKWAKKVKRARAEKVWNKLNDEQKMLAYEKINTPLINAQNQPQYMPHPDKWLAESGWEDEIIKR